MSKTRDHAAMEKRRKQAGKLFTRDLSAPEVARRLGVARQVAYRWKRAWEHGGSAALASKGAAGRKPRLTAEQTTQVTEALLAGPEVQGYKTALWTLPRVAALIEDLTGVGYHPGHVWRLLGASGFSCQRPERRAIERDEKAIRQWKRTTWPTLKKKARQQRRTIVFIDESGLSTRPTRARTWALRGQTPVLHETFNWKSLSIIGGLALWRFYFQIHAGSIKSPQVIEFLRHLQRHVRGKLLIVWDGAPIHRSRLVKNYVVTTRGRIVVERLPAYAPELNPVEYMWGHLKTHEIANLIATKAWELSFEATAALRRMRRRKSMVAACYTQAELWQ
jgi:transposase